MASVRLRRIDAGVRLHRIHRAKHGPIFFGPAGDVPQSRFDSPDGNYKILYAARTLETAFGETLVRTPETPYILTSALETRVRSELETTRTVKLYPLVGAGVSAHGLSFTDLHGADYRRSWKISAEIHATTVADGILYTSRFDNQRCIALFDRAADALAETSTKGVAIGAARATALAHHFGKRFIEP